MNVSFLFFKEGKLFTFKLTGDEKPTMHQLHEVAEGLVNLLQDTSKGLIVPGILTLESVVDYVPGEVELVAIQEV